MFLNNTLFTHYTHNDGLPSSSVTALLSDSEGYLWLGTRNGLVRYDGFHFQTFIPDSDKPGKIKGRNISCLFEDDKGYIWIGTILNGINVYNPSGDVFHHITQIPDESNSLAHYEVQSITQNPGGDILVSFGYASGINRIRLSENANPLQGASIDHFLPAKLPDQAYQLIDSLRACNQVIAALVKIQSNQFKKIEFSIENREKVWVIAYGEKGFESGSLSNWVDEGWIEDLTGNKVFEMNAARSLHAGGWQNGAFRIEAVALDLPASTYNLYFKTNNYRAFRSWDNLQPDHPEYYGIQVIKLNEQSESQFNEIMDNVRSTSSILDSHVGNLISDSQGKIWLGSFFGATVLNFDESQVKFVHHIPDRRHNGRIKSFFPGCLATSKSGGVWLAGMNLLWDGGLVNFYNNSSRKFYDLNFEVPKGNWINCLLEDSPGNLWLGSSKDGLYQIITDPLDTNTNRIPVKSKNFQFEHIKEGRNVTASISSITEDHSGIIWIGTRDNGLFKYDPLNNQFVHHLFDSLNYSNAQVVTEIFEDDQGMIWIGTKSGQLLIYDLYKKTDRIFWSLAEEYSFLNTSPITSICQTQDGIVWIGTKGNGIYKYLKRNRKLEHYLSHQNKKGLCNNFIRNIKKDKDGVLWIATANGVNSLRPNEDNWHSYYHDENDSFSIISNDISDIFNDDTGNVWFQARKGGITTPIIVRQDNRTEIRWKHYLNGEIINGILNYHDQIWTYGFGLQRISNSKEFNKPKPIKYDAILPDHNIIDIYKDSNENWWLTTELYGLFKYDPKQDSIVQHISTSELNDQSITDIWIDEAGSIWVFSQSHGLLRLSNESPQNLNILKFGKHRGLLISQNYRSKSFKASNGNVLITNEFGIYDTNTDSLKIHENSPEVIYTGFKLYGKNIEDINDPVFKNEIQKNRITLNYKQKVFSIKYAALHFDSPEKIKYQYKLEGLNEDWIEAGSNREALYNHIPAGNYSFIVKAKNPDGIWSDEKSIITLQILPPWWFSWWAYLLYTLISGTLFYGWRRYDLHRISLKQDLQMKEFEKKQLEELVEVKSRFYTSISHEFRTPITIILGMADQIVKQPARRLSHAAELIKRNGKQVLSLVNQLLDLSKLESGSMQFHYCLDDLVPFLRYLTETFRSYAATKKINVKFESDLDELIMDFDPEAMQKMITNLMSNSIKFTEQYGEIVLSLHSIHENGNAKILIQLNDNGIGIPQDELKHIFDRYYRVDSVLTRASEGTGIGLSLVKELVEGMNGRIAVQSALAKGTVFTICLPILKNAKECMNQVLEENLIMNKSEEEVEYIIPRESTHLTTGFMNELLDDTINLLIVEDNPDVVEYLKMLLEKDYSLEAVHNGHLGIKKAIETVPDLIISDVMMPEKDGFELCEILKTDERTSHIPIVLLTAKSGIKDRILGLKHGADAYLAKPFIQQELMARIEQLLESRRQIQKHFVSNEAANKKPNNKDFIAEDVFLKKVRTKIEENIGQVDFGHLELGKILHMSKTQLYRKVKALTGRSIALYIRLIRLQKAKQLLLTTDMNISEVAYEVGFKNPSHFSRYFSEEFGVSPSGYVESLK